MFYNVFDSVSIYFNSGSVEVCLPIKSAESVGRVLGVVLYIISNRSVERGAWCRI